MEEMLNLTHTWVGYAVLAVFVIGYYLIATEEKFEINKAKPALFIGTFSFMLIGIYFALNNLDPTPLHHEMQKLIEEIAEIFFFLFVAMTYIETLIERGVFDALRFRLISRGYSYKKLFWITGILAFWISPVADNLTTALILSTVLYTIDKHNTNFLVPGAINIVVAANAGGAWSPFGDITTLMAWTAGKGGFIDFLMLFPAAFFGWLLTSWLLSIFVPKGEPHFDALTTPKVELKNGAKVIIFLGFFTIFIAVVGHILFHFPAMWGMMFGLSLLQLYTFYHKRKYKEHINIFVNMSKVENDTLLFFFGILSAVGALAFLGWLIYVTKLYEIIGPTWANIGVGFISAIIDNVPVMAAILKANPPMGIDQWMLVTLTAGIGGSLISFGSAAGVGVMGRMRGVYTFFSHMKFAWAVLAGYILSVIIWYIQFEILGLY
ncbi:sodium:proton antiporter [Caminibacter mediatlanticus TB-2]|uniref:Sodium:proton antiporter n=1 Tax=Caminibacter mediatlanticus TB-2 TaxID=391592 RepID=A0ABX5V8S7_9BACT|nr:sodium:proton antiporter NhaD [Caminibacter mediatlanticus]QCT94685.1 sodium:proton antiporter [Caminibacter mediatlanticus TB-2]